MISLDFASFISERFLHDFISGRNCIVTIFVIISYVRHQLENHRKRTTCPICGKSCARTESLNVHMLLIHKVHDSKIANKVSPSCFCQINFISIECEIVLHFLLKLHRCKEPGCGYVCLYKKRVEEHALKHKDTKQHKCNICSKMFKHEKLISIMLCYV